MGCWDLVILVQGSGIAVGGVQCLGLLGFREWGVGIYRFLLQGAGVLFGRAWGLRVRVWGFKASQAGC